MSNQRKKKANLPDDSYYDLLTGARTRNGMTVDFERPHRFPLGIIAVDVNGVLETMREKDGFAKTDLIIKDIVKTIQRVLPDEVCYRLSLDLFCIVCENAREKDFYGNMFLLQDAFRRNGEKKRAVPHYYVSVGACHASAIRDLNEVHYEAIQNMYQNKRMMYRLAGSEGSRYRPLQDKVLEFLKEGELRRKIKDGRFLVYYQPQMSLTDGTLKGAEALIRYLDDNGSISFPIDFLPSLESAKRISEIDFYVFEHVCKKLRVWNRKRTQPVCISTNFSRHTITEESFADHLLKIRNKYGIPSDQIEVEITETVEGESSALLRKTIKELHERGFRISIDDFGVSHSTLSLLTDLEFDVLKFDKSVIDMLYTRLPDGSFKRNNKTVLLLSSLIGVCHQMNVKTVAEGVEEAVQADLLDIINCDLAQGYHYSRPVKESEFEAKYLSR